MVLLDLMPHFGNDLHRWLYPTNITDIFFYFVSYKHLYFQINLGNPVIFTWFVVDQKNLVISSLGKRISRCKLWCQMDVVIWFQNVWFKVIYLLRRSRKQRIGFFLTTLVKFRHDQGCLATCYNTCVPISLFWMST